GPAPDAQQCFGSLTQLCLAAPPTGELMLTEAIDTSSDARCTTMSQAGGPDLCVMSGGVVQVSGNVTTTGSRPLVLIAASTLIVSGTLDASSTQAGAVGGGADAGECVAPAPPGGGSGGGGAGGSFGDTGGGGGNGYGGGGSAPSGAQTLTAVRGGCPGID